MESLLSNLEAGLGVGLILLLIAIVVAHIVAIWKQFQKAGQPGWASIVPFYRDYISYKICWGEGWLFLAPLVLSVLNAVPIVSSLASLLIIALYAVLQYKKSEAFGHGIVFAVGLFLLPIVFDLMLAFGSEQYLGIPQDGFSYEQLRRKYKFGEKKIDYAQPSGEEDKRDIDYTSPDDKSDR